jgi:hypothetical protein
MQGFKQEIKTTSTAVLKLWLSYIKLFNSKYLNIIKDLKDFSLSDFELNLIQEYRKIIFSELVSRGKKRVKKIFDTT